MKKIIFILLISFFFNSTLNAKGISYAKQQGLIDSGAVSIGMSCYGLIQKLGKEKDLNRLPLGNRDGKYGHYFLIEVASKEENKIYYLCEQKRTRYEDSDLIDNILKDQNLIKIFYESANMFRYVFLVTSDGSVEYILKRLTASDFNITRDELIIIYTESLADRIEQSTEIVKIEEPEPTQPKPVEPAKPELVKKDEDGPLIKIAKTIKVDSRTYNIKGKVEDKSGFYLVIDGEEVTDEYIDDDGNFSVPRLSLGQKFVEKIKIVAIDKWRNKTEKIVTIKIKRPKATTAISYEKLDPNKIKTKADDNKIAIIIGIEKYENLKGFDATFANRDAGAFREYATKALGVKPANIKLLTDKNAKRRDALKVFKLWLPQFARDGGKDIYIFFAGHGLASDDGKDLFILPYDGDLMMLEDTAISRAEIISLVEKVKPKSVTMFFDTCYSGQTRDEKSLVASLRPIRLRVGDQTVPDKFHIFSASTANQTSGSIVQAKHGVFSYYLMKGLEGKADKNKDNRITNGELVAFLKTNVTKESLAHNRQQEPTLSGDPDQVLIKYR